MEESKEEMIELAMPKSCSLETASLSPLKKGIVDTTEQLQEDFSSPTPVKNKESSRISNKEEIAELPEKFEDLLEFFNCMTSSLRLLRLRKQKPHFQNVRKQVETSTRRKFLPMHLAQIKYILPEAVKVDKVLVHDEKTQSMVPDMEITLLTDVVKDHGEESLFIALSNLFSSKLRKYCISQPEDTDVPEAELPEPFNHRTTITVKKDPISKDLSTSFEAETLNVQDTDVLEAEVLPASSETKILNASHFSPTFRRHFSEKPISIEIEKTNLPSDATFASFSEEFEKPKVPDSSSETGKIEATPVKIPLISDSDIVATPMQSTPMRSMSPSKLFLTCEDDKKSTVAQDNKLSTSAVKKSLYFSLEGEDTTISHKQSVVSLSSLIPLIHQIFKTIDFCPITKEELVHKIIMHNLEIDDKGEVETQMEHLEKLVPEWFFKKLAASGDLLYSVTKVSDLNSVCEKVEVI